DLKQHYGLPLVVDFRDAWLEYPYHLYWTSWHRRRHEELERSVVNGADAVVVTNLYLRGLLLGRNDDPAVAERIHVITQGFDPADFDESTGVELPAIDGSVVNFLYTGIFYEDRDPLVLYRALAMLKERDAAVYRRMVFHM